MVAVEVKLQLFLILEICMTSTPKLPLRKRNLGYVLVVRMYSFGDRGSTVVKVLCYKSEGCWFDPRW